MAYAPSYGRPPPRQPRSRGPPPAVRGPRQQQGPGYHPNSSSTNNSHNHGNRAYQQDWQQNNYEEYQGQGDPYQDYASANPYYDDQTRSQHNSYVKQHSSWGTNGYGYPEQRNGDYSQRPDQAFSQGYDQAYDQSYDQAYQQGYDQQGYNAGYDSYAEDHRARPPPRGRQQGPPPPQNYPSGGPPPQQSYPSRSHPSPQNYPPRGPPPQQTYSPRGPPPQQSHPPQAPPQQQNYPARDPTPYGMDPAPPPAPRQQPQPPSSNPGPPPSSNGYDQKQQNQPAPIQSPPQQRDRSAFQVSSPTEMAWDNPFPKWPIKRDNSREPPAVRSSQEQSRYSAEANRPNRQTHSSRPSQDQSRSGTSASDYVQQSAEPVQQVGPANPQGSYDNGPSSWEKQRKPPPNFSRARQYPSDSRPGTATGARAVPPKLDIPQQARTQPPTPVGQNFSQADANSYHSQSPPQQTSQPSFGYDRNIDSAFVPPRPGTAPASDHPTYNSEFQPPSVRAASPEEMPAFGNSTSTAEHDPLHTTTPVESTGAQSKYTAYSPQVAPQRQHSFGTSGTPIDQDRAPHSAGPWISRDRPPAQLSQQSGLGYQQASPPLRRAATSDDQTYQGWDTASAPGSRNGPLPGRGPYMGAQGPALDGHPPPTLDRQANNFPAELPYGRPKPQGPPRPVQGGPDSRVGLGSRGGAAPAPPGPTGSARPNGPGAPPNPRGPGPRPNPQMYPPRSHSANPRPGASSSGPPNQQSLQPNETQERKQDPDALPHHPTPIRPGLMAGGPQGKEKPVPVRQYSGLSQEQSSSEKKKKRKSTPVTQEELSRLRAAISKNPNDDEIRFTLAKKLAEASIVLADDGGRADARMKAHNQQRFSSEAREILKKLVSRNHSDAMFFLADCYSEGKFGAQQDAKEAFNLYQSAGKLGHAAASYRTAVCCEIGPEEGGGTIRDTQKAVQWYKRASSLGDVPATFKVGVILLNGLMGQTKNLNEAIAYLKKAADHADVENPHAFHELGLLYENPNHPQLRDEAYALECFNKAAKLGYRFSQFKLGQVYEYGLLGCPADPRLSIVNYTKAAAQGEHEAELALSGWYLTGSEGILEHNDTEAYLWARKAATADPPVAKALFAMGYFTEVGIGCPRSLEEAKKWYGRSASANFPKARQRLDELQRGGSGAQKQRERLSRSNQRRNEENCTVM